MKNIIIYIAIAVSLLMSGCDPGIITNPVHSPGIPSGVKASILAYTDRIRITWNAVPEASSYRIYRYACDGIKTLDTDFQCSTNYYEDTSAVPGTSYFYKVTAENSGGESGLSGNYVEGIFFGTIDAFEPNNNTLTAKTIDYNPISPVIYTFSLGEAQDKDCYTLSDPDLVQIHINLPDTTDFDGLLTIKIENTGYTQVLSEGNNTVSFDGLTNSGNLSFSIYFTIVDPSINIIDTYDIDIDPI